MNLASTFAKLLNLNMNSLFAKSMNLVVLKSINLKLKVKNKMNGCYPS